MTDSIVKLYGIYGEHAIDGCPLNNPKNRRIVIEAIKMFESPEMLKQIKEKYKIHNIVGQYHSALEHTFIWIVEAEDPHLIEDFCRIGSPTATFNKVTIVPLVTFREIANRCEELIKNE